MAHAAYDAGKALYVKPKSWDEEMAELKAKADVGKAHGGKVKRKHGRHHR
jgi:hypothetical protein